MGSEAINSSIQGRREIDLLNESKIVEVGRGRHELRGMALMMARWEESKHIWESEREKKEERSLTLRESSDLNEMVFYWLISDCRESLEICSRCDEKRALMDG